MSTIEIRKANITDLDTDVIVNAANDGLWAGGGVCGAIFKAAGHTQLQAACAKIGHCDIGSAVITPGFQLKAKYIIHAVSPVWQGGDSQRSGVTNEIDVMAVRGTQPVFISCKTCEIKTEALNELAILRDRFGGKGSRAVIVTSAAGTKSRAVMRRRAAELDIEVIEWDDLPLDKLVERLKQQ